MVSIRWLIFYFNGQRSLEWLFLTWVSHYTHKTRLTTTCDFQSGIRSPVGGSQIVQKWLSSHSFPPKHVWGVCKASLQLWLIRADVTGRARARSGGGAAAGWMLTRFSGSLTAPWLIAPAPLRPTAACSNDRWKQPIEAGGFVNGAPSVQSQCLVRFGSRWVWLTYSSSDECQWEEWLADNGDARFMSAWCEHETVWFVRICMHKTLTNVFVHYVPLNVLCVDIMKMCTQSSDIGRLLTCILKSSPYIVL